MALIPPLIGKLTKFLHTKQNSNAIQRMAATAQVVIVIQNMGKLTAVTKSTSSIQKSPLTLAPLISLY